MDTRVVHGNNIIVKLASLLNGYYKAGNIALIYSTGYERDALDIASILDKGGYRTRTVSINASLDAISDEYRYCVGVGDYEVVKALRNLDKPYCLCLSEPSLRCLDSITADSSATQALRLPELVVLDEKLMSGEWQAALFGEIIQLYQVVIDAKLLQCLGQRTSADDTEELLKVLDEFAMRQTLDNAQILAAYAQVAKYYSAVNRSAVNSAVAVAASLISRDKNIAYGDACMLASVYYAYTSYALVGSEIELAFPPDKTKIAERISALSRIPIDTLVTNMRRASYAKTLKYDYIIREYAQDIKGLIDKRFVIFNNACRLWRRLKSDVGYAISRNVTIREVAQAVSCATVIGNGYGVVRHYVELGIA